jgi:hypothetical protein
VKCYIDNSVRLRSCIRNVNSHHTEKEATWESEEELKVEFPSFFSNSSESRGRDSF